MSQSVQVLIGTVFGFAGVLVLIVIRLTWRPQPEPDTDPAPQPGVVAVAFRYCPAELRTRAAIVHTDGTAACLDCATPIPTETS